MDSDRDTNGAINDSDSDSDDRKSGEEKLSAVNLLSPPLTYIRMSFLY
jgi:hypothetical protein